MEIYVFDRDLNLLGLLEGFFNLRWVRRYGKRGEFELHCGLTQETLTLLQRGNIVWKSDDLEAGCIEYCNITLNSVRDEVLIVKGKFLTGYLDRRIIWGTERISKIAEKVMRDLVYRHAVAPVNNDRAVPLLQLGALKDLGQLIDKQANYSNLLEVIEGIAAASGLGIRMIFDGAAKAINFDVYEGSDRTAGQSANAPAIFSQEYENVLEQEYVGSLNNYRNVALVGGVGEGSERALVTVGGGVGLDRFEVFADQRSLTQDEGVTGEEYAALLAQKGFEVLAENVEIQAFESKVNLNSNLTYKMDFDLGDIVTCVSASWGLTIDTRITEIEEIYEEKGFEVNVTFGNSVPTLIDKIKQVVRQ